jgi:hypothetical protein
VSASVSGPEPRKGSPKAGTRGLLRAIAIAAALLVAALAATPAWADDTGGTGPSPTTVDSPPASDGNSGGAVTPPPNPTDTTTPGGSGGATPTAPQDPPPPPPADPTPPADTGHGSGSDPGGSGSTTPVDRAPSHSGSGDSSGTSSSSASGSSTPTGSTPSGPAITPPTDPTATGYPGDWGGQDTFLLDARGSGGTGGPPTGGGYHSRFAGLFGLGVASRATRIEARERRGQQTAKVSPLGGGPPGQGGRLPSQNPFFNLLSGPGGAGAGLLLLSLLAVLGAAIALPSERSKAFRTPTAPWRPLAYVPPIELPG